MLYYYTVQLDGCIVWNAHNTVFGSKRSAICAQAVYFLHSTMSSVTCPRLSDVSIICHVTYLQFPIQACFSSTSVRQAAQRHRCANGDILSPASIHLHRNAISVRSCPTTGVRGQSVYILTSSSVLCSVTN